MRWILPFAIASALLIAAACHGAPKTSYTLTVAFNDRYTDAAGSAVEDAVHQYDAGARVLLRETFPPVATATIRTGRTNVCDQLRRLLQPRPDVASIDCSPLNR